MAITSVPIWSSVSCDMCLFIRLRIDMGDKSTTASTPSDHVTVTVWSGCATALRIRYNIISPQCPATACRHGRDSSSGIAYLYAFVPTHESPPDRAHGYVLYPK